MRARPAPLFRRFGLTLGALAAALAGAEALVRLAPGLLSVDARTIAGYRAWRCDGEVAGFRPHPYFQVTRAPSTIETNALGFHGADWPLERRPGVLRIVCLGGSTTEGGNEDGIFGSYPDRLREGLELELSREVEVFNAGISGWTTAESLLSFLLLLQDYRPDLVIVHHAVNDVEPRLYAGFRSDYSHLRRAAAVQPAAWPLRPLLRGSDLVVALAARGEPPTLESLLRRADSRGLPAPAAAPADAFRRNALSLVHAIEEAGADALLLTMPANPSNPRGSPDDRWRAGIAEHNDILREIAAREGCLLADAEAAFASMPREVAPWFLDLVHVSTVGNLAKATVVLRALVDSGWLDAWR